MASGEERIGCGPAIMLIVAIICAAGLVLGLCFGEVVHAD